MKVLVINNNAMFSNSDGLHIFKNTGEFLVGLKNAGAKVETFHFELEMGENNFMATFNLLKTGLKISSVHRGKYKYFSYIKAYIVGINRLLKNDFLYIFYPNSFVYLALFAIIFRKPYGIYLRGENGVNSMKSKFFFKHAQIVLTVSPVFSNSMKHYKCISETISPMINYTIKDIAFDRNYPNKTQYKLLFLGRVEIQKGIKDLINAVKLLINNDLNNISLDVVGDGPDFSAMKTLVNDLDIDSFITFHGTILDKDKTQEFYLNSDLFISPTHPNHEGFPRVLYEAMILGCPIIGTTVGAISYLMKDSYNIYQIEHKNPKSLAEKIAMIMKNYQLGEMVAKNAMNTVKEYLTDRQEAHHNQLYRLIKENNK